VARDPRDRPLLLAARNPLQHLETYIPHFSSWISANFFS
jgi:hypothetical protein